MKNSKIILFITFFLLIFSCRHADEDQDVLSQEDISDIVLNIKDNATGTVQSYDYTLNSVNNPVIKLADGRTYTVSAVFLNGTKDATAEIIEAKNEHFLIFNFINSSVSVTRMAGVDDLRADGNRVGLTTVWQVQKAVTGAAPQLILTLNHGAESVSEKQNGTAFGSAQGGETDAMATYGISN